MLDGKVIVFGAGPGTGNGGTITFLSGFGPFSHRSTLPKHGLVVTQGQTYSNILREIEGFPIPGHGVMKLDNTVTIDWITTMSSSSGYYDEGGSSLFLIILTGEVW